LSGRRYNSRNAVGSAVYQCLEGIPRADYSTAFQSWIERLRKCVAAKGNILKGWIKWNQIPMLCVFSVYLFANFLNTPPRCTLFVSRVILNKVKHIDTKQSNKRNNQNSKSKDKTITWNKETQMTATTPTFMKTRGEIRCSRRVSINSMNHSIWVSSLSRLKPKAISDKVFETWF